MFRSLFREARPSSAYKMSGIDVFLLQSRLERFTEEQLNLAMQSAWNRTRDEDIFWAKVENDDNSLIKMEEAYFHIVHRDFRLSSKDLETHEIPAWADHAATTHFAFHFSGGVEHSMVPLLYGFAGKLVARLASTNTKAIFYKQAGVFVPATPAIIARLRRGAQCVPADLLKSGAESASS